MTHRALHQRTRRDPTEARAEHVPQMVDRKVTYSCLPQRGLPGRLNGSDRLVGFHRTRKKERARTSLLLFPTMKNTSRASPVRGTGSDEPSVLVFPHSPVKDILPPCLPSLNKSMAISPSRRSNILLARALQGRPNEN